jgi:hypothetical protein
VRSVVRIYPGPPLKVRGCSSAGRAPALQAGGHRFDPGQLHQPPIGTTSILPIDVSSRPERSAVEGPAVPLCSQANAKARTALPFVIPSVAEGSAVVPVATNSNCSKLSIPKRMLTFEQRRKAICSNPPQGGHRIKPRCNWMFDNEIDWVNIYKAEQVFS